MHKKEIRFQLLCHIIMGIAAVVTILPLILLFISSITANKDITLYGYSFVPKHLSMEAYSYIWNERMQIFRAYFITVFVTAVGTGVGLSISVLYAYALSKPYFPGKKFFSFFILFTMLFNGGWCLLTLCIPGTCI